MRLRLVHDLICVEQATTGGPEAMAPGPPVVYPWAADVIGAGHCTWRNQSSGGSPG